MAVDQIDPLDDIRAVGESAQAVIANPKSGREWIIFGIAVVGIFTSFDDSFHAFRRGGRRHKKHHSDGDGGGGGGNPKKRKDGDGPDGGDGVESGKAGAPNKTVTSGGTANAAQLNRLKVQYAADEILNARRVGSGLKTDPSHRAASYLSREQLEAGKVFTIRGGDGTQRTLLQTQGGFNGKQGIYEYIIDSNGSVVHQRFIDGGAITGVPNCPVRNLPR